MMYRLRLIHEGDKFKFIDVVGDEESVTELATYIDILKRIYLPTEVKDFYWNLEGIYTIDGTEVSKSIGIEIKHDQ